MPGFAVRVTDKRQRSFVLVTRYPRSPNPTARAVGTVCAITLEDARAKAREWLRLISAGVDLQKSRRRPRQRRGIRYVQSVKNTWDGMAPKLRTVEWRRAALDRIVYPVLGAKPIGQISAATLSGCWIRSRTSVGQRWRTEHGNHPQGYELARGTL